MEKNNFAAINQSINEEKIQDKRKDEMTVANLSGGKR